MSSKKLVIKNSIIYTFSKILLLLLNFIILPIYTKYLTPAEYGILGLVSSFTAIASIFITFNLGTAISRFYIEYSENLDLVKQLFGSIVLFVTVSGLLFFFVFFIFSDFLSNIFFGEISFYPIIMLALLVLIFTNIHSLYLSILQILQQARKVAILSTCIFFLNFGLVVLFLVSFHLGVNGKLLGSFVTYVLVSLYIFYDLRKRDLISFKINLKIIKQCLLYSVPIIPHSLANSIATWVSNRLLDFRDLLSSVGFLSLGNQVASILGVFQSSVNLAFTPWLYNKLKNDPNDTGKEILAMTKLLVALNSIAIIGVSYFSQELIFFITSREYHIAWTVVPMISIMYLIKIPYNFYIGTMFYYKELSRRIFWTSSSAAVINITFTAILIPVWGLYGSVLADIIAMSIRVVFVIFLSKNYVKFGFNIFTFIPTIVVSAFLILVGTLPSYLISAEGISGKIFIYKLLIFLVYITFNLFKFRDTISTFLFLIKQRYFLKRDG